MDRGSISVSGSTVPTTTTSYSGGTVVTISGAITTTTWIPDANGAGEWRIMPDSGGLTLEWRLVGQKPTPVDPPSDWLLETPL